MISEAIYLRHILEAISKIETYTRVGRERLFAESHWQDATIRQLEIVGEAVKRLSPETRAKKPEVPWRDVAGMRDFLIHDYLWVDLKTVWETARRDVPVLRLAIEGLLSESE